MTFKDKFTSLFKKPSRKKDTDDVEAAELVEQPLSVDSKDETHVQQKIDISESESELVQTLDRVVLTKEPLQPVSYKEKLLFLFHKLFSFINNYFKNNATLEIDNTEKRAIPRFGDPRLNIHASVDTFLGLLKPSREAELLDFNQKSATLIFPFKADKNQNVRIFVTFKNEYLGGIRAKVINKYDNNKVGIRFYDPERSFRTSAHKELERIAARVEAKVADDHVMVETIDYEFKKQLFQH